MGAATPSLDDLRLAAPCPFKWDRMQGNDVVRRCPGCDKDVVNLSAMTRTDAESYLARTEHGCVMFRRQDGRVMTQSCPAGTAARERRIRRAAVAVGLAIASTILATTGIVRDRRLVEHDPFRYARNWINPVPPPPAPPPPPARPPVNWGGTMPGMFRRKKYDQSDEC